MFDTLKTVFSKKESIIIAVGFASLMALIQIYFTHFEQIRWNMGLLYLYAQIITQILISILFGVNIALLLEKLKFSTAVKSETGTITLAGFLSLLVSGCPACGITLASYLGLASVFSSMPLFGLELKIIGLLLLMYSTNSLSRSLYVCKN